MKNKNIVIIGASSGIGFGLAKSLSKENKVFAFSRNEGDLKDLSNVSFRSLDITSEKVEFESLPEVVDGLVYCPGTINLKPFRRIAEEDFVEDFRINVTGAVKVIQQMYPRLRKSDSAAIVLFSTVAVQTGMNFHSSIAASKGAVEGLVRSLAAEFAPKIRVNAVAPSLTATPLASSLLSTEARQENSSKMHPLQRIGKIDDQVKAVLYLLSEDSSWITGHILPVDGGMSAIKM